ncbi:MAG: 16S rRNA (uracil(1498)-N(3))-methyltransferase [Desulfamplus sp.]|nr:16S rRNA (uracil(1498)-N(3))-methyltransferase [Desulfamplus sp.]
MNLILLFQDDFTKPDRVVLNARRAEHIFKVHRAQIGDLLTVGLLNDKIGTGKVLSMDSVKREIELEVLLTQAPPPPLPLTLVLALPRPKMLKRIFQSIASLGIKNIFIINSWRVEKAFWSSPMLEPKNIQHELILGLEQAKDTVMPEIHLKRLFTPFVTKELSLLKANANNITAITAHPKGVLPCPQNINQNGILVMGPEGGFIDIEIDTLEEAGFTTVNLGQRILRLETAVPFIVSRLYSNI